MDLGVYPLAWARRILGDEYKVTHATAELDSGVDAAFSATLVFPNAVEVHVRSSMVCKQPVARLTIEGARGSLEVTNPLAPQNGHALTISVAEGVTTEVVPGASTYEAQLLALRNAVLNGIPFPLCPDDPVRSMQCLDAVRSAMKEAAAPKLFGINELDLRS
jgi:predicted dehydrogenase